MCIRDRDNDSSNGTEAIEWLVLDVTDDKILVISRYGLDCQPYNKTLESVTWETCTLRKWLNEDFLNAAFTEEERAIIPTVTIFTDKNPEYSTNPGNATQDKIFLLSITEADKYFSSDSIRQCEPTDYAVKNGASKIDSTNCFWWLRSPGNSPVSASIIYVIGTVDMYGFNVNYDFFAVRPALWIDLNA